MEENKVIMYYTPVGILIGKVVGKTDDGDHLVEDILAFVHDKESGKLYFAPLLPAIKDVEKTGVKFSVPHSQYIKIENIPDGIVNLYEKYLEMIRSVDNKVQIYGPADAKRILGTKAP